MAAVSSQINWNDLTGHLAPLGLRPVGGFHPDGAKPAKTIIMIAPDEPAFWGIFSASREYHDGAAHPMDRWSERVLTDLAHRIGGTAFFPFSGPPYHPFFQWALETGQVHQSPIRLAVEHKAGLFIAFRGALGFDHVMDNPPPNPHPCQDCPAPCLTQCPVNAFETGVYAADRCTAHITSDQGRNCWQGGCLARRACPLSEQVNRHPEQARFHMRAFAGR